MTTIQKQIQIIDEQIANLEKEKRKLRYEEHRIHTDDKVNEFLHRYSGVQLLKKHKLDEYGIWEVKGEDPNCDLGGPHQEPHLEYAEGKLEDVIKRAVYLPGFWSWGYGGAITKVEPKTITTIKVS